MSDNPSWNAFKAKLAKAQNRFSQGDSTGMSELYSHEDESSIFGGFGGLERGWQQVAPRLEWAASQNSGGHHEDEFLVEQVGDEFAYTVTMERIRGGINPRTGKDASSDLRVTMIYRREGEDWRIFHRHADPMIDTRPPN